MSDFIERVKDERHRNAHRGEGRHERFGRGDYDDGDSYGRSQQDSYPHRGRGADDDSYGRSQQDSYLHRGRDADYGYDDDNNAQGRRGGYAPPSGPPPSGGGRRQGAFSSQGGLDRGDFASDQDIDRMVAAGEFDGGRHGRGEGRGGEYGRGPDHGYGQEGRGYGQEERRYGRGDGENRRYDVPSGPPPGQGYDRYDTPSGPPPGRGYQNQEEPHRQRYGGDDDYESSYGGRREGQGRPQYDSSQGRPSGYGRGQSGNAPTGGFTASRGEGERYGSGYGGDHDEPPRRGDASGYYEQSSGRGDHYGHLASMAQEHRDDDPEVYRKATEGLHEKIQAQSRRPDRDDRDDYEAHVDAHRKAYGGDDHGPMDADAIGSAAAMEAFKQTVSSNAPAGGFQAGKASGPGSSAPRPGGAAAEEEAFGAAKGGSGGLQDKLMALAMSQAGKLFDKKNAGSATSGGRSDANSGDKAQAMQSAAATAMQLFSKYQSGKLDSSDVSSVMGLAMKML